MSHFNAMPTLVHRTLLTIFAEHHAPLSAQDILALLKKKKLPVNKTTVYRQLATLVADRRIREVRLKDRSVRYELAEANDHHHHLVCLVCKKVEDMHVPNDVEKQERMIWQKKKFKVLHHSLEFFGWCRDCQGEIAK